MFHDFYDWWHSPRPRLEAAGWYAVRVQPGTSAKGWKKGRNLLMIPAVLHCFAGLLSLLVISWNCTWITWAALVTEMKEAKVWGQALLQNFGNRGHGSLAALPRIRTCQSIGSCTLLASPDPTISWNQMYPLVIKHGNGKSHVNGGLHGKIIHKW